LKFRRFSAAAAGFRNYMNSPGLIGQAPIIRIV
jgi:hypothetical protein